MARHAIFCEKEETIPVKVGMKAAYTYMGGIFTIYRREKGKWVPRRQLEVKQFEAVDLLVKNGNIHLIKMSPPPERIHLIGWLCGAPKKCNVTSMSEYEDRVTNYYEEMADIERDEWEVRDSAYSFMWSKLCEEGSVNYCVAYFISEAITLQEIIDLVKQNGVYPSWYMFKLLNERFGISKERYGE